MTISNTTSTVQYVGTGAQATYSIPFKWNTNADLAVLTQDTAGTITVLTLNTDYTLVGAGVPTGGTITLVAGNLALSYLLLVARQPEEIQPTAFPNGSRYFGSDVESLGDTEVMMIQALSQLTSRAIVGPPTEAFDGVLPTAANRANTTLGFDNNGDLSLDALPGGFLASGNFIVDEFPSGSGFTPGVTTALVLSQAPGTVNNVLALFDGVAQQTGTYTLVGTTITFTSVIPIGVLNVEIRQAGVVSINTPANNSVPTAALQNLSVTAAKMADLSVPTRAIQAGAVTNNEMGVGAAVDNIGPHGLSAQMLVVSAYQSAHNAVVGGSAEVGTGTDYAATVSGTFAYGKCPLCKGGIVGTTVAGTFTQGTGSSVGRTGYSFKWNAVTTTGSGTIAWRWFLEAADAAQFISQTAAVSVQARHSSASSVGFVINIYKADVSNDFSAVTLISSSASQSAATNVNKALKYESIAMGACGNGVMIEVVGTIGAVTTKIFELADMQMILSPTIVDINFQSYAEQEQRISWFFERLGISGGVAYLALGQSTDTTHGYFPIQYRMKRAAPTVTMLNIANFSVTKADATPIAAASYLVSAATTDKNARLLVAIGSADLVAGNATQLLTTNANATVTVDARF